MLKKSIHTMIITMISRVLGLFRGTLVAYFFGASVLTDAYYSAFKISNFFRQLLGEGALGNTFIPLYHKKKKEEGEERSREYIFSVLNITFLFSFVVSVLMIIFSSYIIDKLKNIEVEAGIAKYPKLFKIDPIIPDKEINKK